eukprot:scaffold211453_cov29-Prasinocladus_malaysianus.AAC.1
MDRIKPEAIGKLTDPYSYSYGVEQSPDLLVLVRGTYDSAIIHYPYCRSTLSRERARYGSSRSRVVASESKISKASSAFPTTRVVSTTSKHN